MPGAGASARPVRRYAAPWWEELDRDAFRFPAARAVSDARPAPRPARDRTPPALAPQASSRPAPRAAARSGAPAPEPGGIRRTVTIRGYGAERNLPVARPTLRRHERPGFRPDRAALWAVLLGLCLILVAVASAHG
jgi:hypothetical protein